ncbi:MAG: hypothetical protein ACOVO1_05220 [Chitinophagaceae bacterium]
MKKNLRYLLAVCSFSFFVFSCKKSTDDTSSNSSTVPANGWRIGSTNYTTAFAMRNVGQPNSIGAFDAIPGGNNLNTAIVLFNNTTGIAAGTFKVVFKANQSDLLADEIMVGANTGYNQTSGQYDKQYATVIGETVNATVTITGGKAKVVVPQINIISYPVTASSISTTFTGTIAEQ